MNSGNREKNMAVCGTIADLMASHSESLHVQVKHIYGSGTTTTTTTTTITITTITTTTTTTTINSTTYHYCYCHGRVKLVLLLVAMATESPPKNDDPKHNRWQKPMKAQTHPC